MAQETFLARLEAVAARLEKVATRLENAGVSGAANIVADAFAEEEDAPPEYIEAYKTIMDEHLPKIIEAAKKDLGDDANLYKEAFDHVMKIVNESFRCKKPALNEWKPILSPIYQKQEELMQRKRRAMKGYYEFFEFAEWVMHENAGSKLAEEEVTSCMTSINKIRSTNKPFTIAVNNLKRELYGGNLFGKPPVQIKGIFKEYFTKSGLTWNPNGPSLQSKLADNADEQKAAD